MLLHAHKPFSSCRHKYLMAMDWISTIQRTTLFLFAGYLVSFTAEGLSQEPRFNLLARNVTVVTGQRAILPCSVDYLGSYKVLWQSPRGKILTLDDRRIIFDDRVSLERPYVKEWNLHLHNVKTSDAGVYQCQINTDPVQIREVMLHVNEPPKIIDSLSSGATVVVREGDTVELVCNVTGLPTPSVTWYRTNTGLLDDEDVDGKKRIGMEGEVLIIHNVSRYCDDKYECVADNGVPPLDTKEIRVHVEFPPEVRLPNKKIGQVRGKSTILECEITAYPQILSVWKRHGEEIIRNTKYATEIYNDGGNRVTLILKIQSLDKEDYGEYECYALNLLGNDAETMTLYEYHKPEEKALTTTTIQHPWSQHTDGHLINNQDPTGKMDQKNTNSAQDGDYSLWSERNRATGHSKANADSSNDWAEFSRYSGLKNKKKDYESEAESESVISNPEDGLGKNTAHTKTSRQNLVIILLLFHIVYIR